MPGVRTGLFIVGVAVALLAPANAALAPSGSPSFKKPVAVSEGWAYQAGEPSIRVDAGDPNERIWIAAPSGIGVDSRGLTGDPDTGGDIFWYSDDDGKTFKHLAMAGAVGPTIPGGGDSDVATGFGDQVYGTGLTLANVTLAASCDNGGVFASNPVGAPGGGDDRQWIDTYEDRAAPLGAPDLVLDYGNIGAQRVVFHQVFAGDGCAPPAGAAPLDTSLPGTCTNPALGDPTCYQWPGNLAVDERNGDVYVTYNTS